MKRLGMVAVLLAALSACDRTTARLTPAQEQRFAAEGVLRRADDLVFRYTKDPGGRSERWEDRRASIVVTKSTVLIHKNEKLGIQLTPRTQRDVAIERSGDRIRIRSGRGRSEEIWSFEPPDDASGWARDIRAVVNPPKPSSPVDSSGSKVVKAPKRKRKT